MAKRDFGALDFRCPLFHLDSRKCCGPWVALPGCPWPPRASVPPEATLGLWMLVQPPPAGGPVSLRCPGRHTAALRPRCAPRGWTASPFGWPRSLADSSAILVRIDASHATRMCQPRCAGAAAEEQGALRHMLIRRRPANQGFVAIAAPQVDGQGKRSAAGTDGHCRTTPKCPFVGLYFP
jgi:hypothetical protein